MRLIVNADDLGYTAGVTRGIVRAHREGIVTSTTLMTNAPDAEGAGRAARDTPGLDVGVHLVFTFGRPLSDPSRVRSLVTAGGAFPHLSDVMRGDRVRSEDALTEARAQHARARELIGREPTHIDTHHWVHDVPAIEDAMAALAMETGAAARAHDPAQRDRFRAKGIRTTDRFVRDYQHPRAIESDALAALLETLAREDGSVELMCHPGEVDDELRARSAYAAERAIELRALTDPSIRAIVRRLGIELIGHAAL